jgi:hypothetical protein
MLQLWCLMLLTQTRNQQKKDVTIVVDFDIVELIAISQELAICEQFYSIKKLLL